MGEEEGQKWVGEEGHSINLGKAACSRKTLKSLKAFTDPMEILSILSYRDPRLIFVKRFYPYLWKSYLCFFSRDRIHKYGDPIHTFVQKSYPYIWRFYPYFFTEICMEIISILLYRDPIHTYGDFIHTFSQRSYPYVWRSYSCFRLEILSIHLDILSTFSSRKTYPYEWRSYPYFPGSKSHGKQWCYF